VSAKKNDSTAIPLFDCSSPLFELMLDASGMAVAIRDRELHPIFTNKAFTDLYGYSRDEIPGLRHDAVLLAETIKPYKREVLPFMMAGESWEGKYTIRRKGGTMLSVWGRFDPVFNDDGSLTHVISFMQDISESALIRKALTQSEQHLNFLAENTSDCLFRIRLEDGHCDYISLSVQGILGYTPQELYDNPMMFMTFFPDGQREQAEIWWEEFCRGISRYDYEIPMVHKNGTRKLVHMRIKVVFDDRPVAIEGILTDVTDRRNVEGALATAQKSLNFISNSSSDIFFRLRFPEGKYDYLSPSVESITGYTPEDYDDNPLFIRQIIPPEWQEWFQETWDEFMRGEVRPEYVFPYIHKSGEKRWVSQRVVLRCDEDGNTTAIEGITTDITERKRAEDAVRASEERFRFLTENITDVIWTMDNDFRFTYATSSAERVWGYSMEALQGRSLAELITPDSRDVLKDASRLRADMEEAGDYSLLNRIEMEIYHGRGGTLWSESMVGRLMGEDGEPAGYQGVTRDISQRREAAAEIARREARFRTLFEDSPISLWEEDLSELKVFFDSLKEQGVTDFRQYFFDNPDTLAKCATLVKVVDVNKATLELLGADSKEELFGSLEKILTESSMMAFTEEMLLIASGGREYCGEITHRTLDDEIIWVMVHFFVPDEYQETLSRVIVSLQDVTPRKKAEEALRDSEERYRILAENSQEGVIVVQEGQVRYVNESMADIFGYSIDELHSMHPLDRCHPEDRESTLKQLEPLLKGRKETGYASFRIIDKSGEVKWLILNIKPLIWGGKKALLEILTDVTRHKALEEELRIAHAQMEDRVRKRTTELSEANLRLQAEAKERDKAQERILSLTQQIIRVQEDERQRIARDLHDNVAQDLSSLMLKMETLFDDHDCVDDELEQRGESVTMVLRKAIASVRDIAYGLRPPALDQLGLGKALENLCMEAGNKNGFDVDFFATGLEEADMDFDAEINVYRMVQEAVRNIARHSMADKATIRMVKSHPDVLIRIEDNGQGFSVGERMSEAEGEKRMGIRSMEERARLIGGSMEIQSLAGTGTRVIFKVPASNSRRQN